MEYRTLGATGLRVSEIGLGCEGLIGKSEAYTEAFFRCALEHGVNCMDLYSPDPDMQRRVGRAVGPVRRDFILQAHLCTRWRDGQYEAIRDLGQVKAAFETQLENLGTSYLDVGMIHYVDSEATWRQVVDNGILDYALEEKARGRIRHVGLSSHNPTAALRAIRTGKIEVLMFSVNPCYDLLPGTEDVEDLWAEASYEKPLFNLDPQREELYETCQRMGVGITVMKAFGGGDLLSETDSPAGEAMTAVQCLHYALTRPAVGAVMCGARSLEDLRASLAYEDATEEARDYASVFVTFPKISWAGRCMYCGHCAPCPKGIPIADVTRFLNLALAQGEVPETVRQHYGVLPARGGDCISCGACERRCPFGVPVRENMARANEIFGS